MKTVEEVKTVEFRCPFCGHSAQISEHLLGQQVHCPNPECERPFMTGAPQGIPVTSPSERHEDAPVVDNVTHDDEQVVLIVHPSMWRRHPFRFFGLVGALVLGVVMMSGGFLLDTSMLGLAAATTATVGFVMATVAGLTLLSWWVKVRYTQLTISNKRTVYREGIIARETTEVRHSDVRNLQLDQNVFERIMSVGDIAVSSSGQDEIEIQAHDIPHPQHVVATIRDMQ